MGRSVVAVLVAASVFYHTVVGCCAHHAHATTCTGNSVPQSRQKVAKQAGHRCHGHAHGRCSHHRAASRLRSSSATAGESRHPHHPAHLPCPCHGPDGCDEASCAFALAKPASLPEWSCQDALFLNVPMAAAAGLTATMANASWALGQSDVWWPEKLRAHLFLQNLRN